MSKILQVKDENTVMKLVIKDHLIKSNRLAYVRSGQNLIGQQYALKLLLTDIYVLGVGRKLSQKILN